MRLLKPVAEPIASESIITYSGGRLSASFLVNNARSIVPLDFVVARKIGSLFQDLSMPERYVAGNYG